MYKKLSNGEEYQRVNIPLIVSKTDIENMKKYIKLSGISGTWRDLLQSELYSFKDMRIFNNLSELGEE